MRKKITVLTGAGMSADSGLKTFRDADGLWEGHDVMEVASPQGFRANPELVLEFYNERRRQLLQASPNAGHEALVELEMKFDTHIVTQNVDDLHERAGSSQVLHLHGELFKVRSTAPPYTVYDWKKDLHLGDRCKAGSQLRPHIVWFGEEVPLLPHAASLTSMADILIIVGTSLQVYPAASLLYYASEGTPIYLVDPRPALTPTRGLNLHLIPRKASEGVPELVSQLLETVG
ncbi:NAD-dependent deacetylase [Muriicola jejuensis]|uniref:NAD-dependent protein deacylase n=1 Tax=Muriicola jejuensis TaxID=504488 RepID=A0A6P0UGQ9_9FLAO|nr:NAD-dependent deacylase [Muriicola jejuensis]NER10988.1 NAD-dependent deacylase [Muriicola jejuensis]SMP15055.1 NAD-dependent deacetylase [Muriicola jejuensis]